MNLVLKVERKVATIFSGQNINLQFANLFVLILFSENKCKFVEYIIAKPNANLFCFFKIIAI